MRHKSTMLLIAAIGVLSVAAGWVLMHAATEARAAEEPQREITSLKRKVDDLTRRLEELEDALQDRQKAIAVSSSGVTIKASRVTIDGGFEINLDANTIKLNDGRRAVARVGSKVGDDQQIGDGARSVLVP
ncbi:MAG: hypothetical protein RIC55_29150 [Pirellulaceae bacterium]